MSPPPGTACTNHAATGQSDDASDWTADEGRTLPSRWKDLDLTCRIRFGLRSRSFPAQSSSPFGLCMLTEEWSIS